MKHREGQQRAVRNIEDAGNRDDDGDSRGQWNRRY